jgi:hypothetical protein
MFSNIPASAITTIPDLVAPMEMLASRPARRGLHIVDHNACTHHSSPFTDPLLSCFGMFQNATL